jgi:hypothetical protein
MLLLNIPRMYFASGSIYLFVGEWREACFSSSRICWVLILRMSAASRKIRR